MDYKEQILKKYRKRHKGVVLSWLFENFINSLPSEKEIAKGRWISVENKLPIIPKTNAKHYDSIDVLIFEEHGGGWGKHKRIGTYIRYKTEEVLECWLNCNPIGWQYLPPFPDWLDKEESNWKPMDIEKDIDRLVQED